MFLNQPNALVIGQYTQALNNRLFDLYGKIMASINTPNRWELTQAVQKVKSFFLARCHQNNDNVTKTVTKNLNQVSKVFTKTVKVSTQVSTEKALYKWEPYYSFLLRIGRVFRHGRREFSDTLERESLLAESANYARPKDRQRISLLRLHGVVFAKGFSTPIKRDYFFTGFANFSRQAFFTQPENESPSFFACCWINSSKSSSKRICFMVLFERSKSFFSFLSCIGSYQCDRLDFKGSYHYISNYLKKAIPRSAGTLSRDLTQPLNGVMIMANRYDSAHLRAEQSQTTNHKKHLPNDFKMGYSNSTLAKSKGRIETLNYYSATHDALSVFFCVNAYAHLYNRFSSMVALAGHPKGWLVSEYASSLNPVNVTAQEIETSRGDYATNYSEDATMATIPTTFLSTQKLFKFYNLSTAQVVQSIALTEPQARKQLGGQSLIFIAQIRLYSLTERLINLGGYSHV